MGTSFCPVEIRLATGLAEIEHPDYPGERLVACKNPLLAEEPLSLSVRLGGERCASASIRCALFQLCAPLSGSPTTDRWSPIIKFWRQAPTRTFPATTLVLSHEGHW